MPILRLLIKKCQSLLKITPNTDNPYKKATAEAKEAQERQQQANVDRISQIIDSHADDSYSHDDIAKERLARKNYPNGVPASQDDNNTLEFEKSGDSIAQDESDSNQGFWSKLISKWRNAKQPINAKPEKVNSSEKVEVIDEDEPKEDNSENVQTKSEHEKAETLSETKYIIEEMVEGEFERIPTAKGYIRTLWSMPAMGIFIYYLTNK